MSRYIVKVDQENGPPLYGMWCDNWDCPATPLKTIVGFTSWYRREHGCSGLEQLTQRLERVWQTGTSARGETAKSLMDFNRYGEDEEHLDVQEVVEKWKRKSGCAG